MHLADNRGIGVGIGIDFRRTAEYGNILTANGYPDMQIPQMTQHFRENLRQFELRLRCQRAGPVGFPQLVPINLRANRKHCITPVVVIPDTVENIFREIARNFHRLRNGIVSGSIVIRGNSFIHIHHKEAPHRFCRVHIHNEIGPVRDHCVVACMPAVEEFRIRNAAH